MPHSRRWLPAAACALALLAYALAPGPSRGQSDACQPAPDLLSPKGGAGGRFTMLIRVNKPRNVTAYAQLQSSYGQLRTRDVFVVNTRFKGTSAGRRTRSSTGSTPRSPAIGSSR